MSIRSAIAAALLLIPGAAQAAANPWLGTWKVRLKASDEKPETLVYSDAGQGAMRMVSVEQNSVVITRFDGQPAPDIGSEAGRTRTLAIQATSPTRYRWTFSLNGKPYVRGINTLAADGRTFEEVSWLVSAPGKRVTNIYDRQAD